VGNIESALTASRNAADELIANAISSSRAWDAPCAPGKWSPSQIVEHVARSYEASVNVASGQPSAFPNVPTFLHPLVRIVFRRILRRGALPKGRTTKAMNPAAGAATPADGRTRLMAAHQRFEAACRTVAARRTPMNTPMFGAVAVEDFVRFMELHTRHHLRQIA
jgi:Protein of unknown function (DUF1569)